MKDYCTHCSGTGAKYTKSRTTPTPCPECDGTGLADVQAQKRAAAAEAEEPATIESDGTEQDATESGAIVDPDPLAPVVEPQEQPEA